MRARGSEVLSERLRSRERTGACRGRGASGTSTGSPVATGNISDLDVVRRLDRVLRNGRSDVVPLCLSGSVTDEKDHMRIETSSVDPYASLTVECTRHMMFFLTNLIP